MWKDKLKNLEYNNLYPLFFTIIFILILIQYSFNSLDAIFYDGWVRTDVGSSTNENIIVIPMDEESDQFLGETFPYTYATHKRFIEKVLEDKPLVIDYLVPFLDPASEEENYFYKSFKELLQNYKANGGGFRFGTNRDAWGEQIPPEGLASLGYSLAILNKDGNIFARDEVTRRTILNISGEDSLHLWTANFYNQSKGKKSIEASNYQGSYYNREADATFSLFRYSTSPVLNETDYETIPFHRVVVGNFPRGYFKNKIVLIGPQYLSNSADFAWTPFNKDSFIAPQLLVHANIIDALIAEKTVYAVPDWVSDMLAIIIAIFLSFIISRLQPAKGLMTIIGLMGIIFLVGYLLFISGGIWLKLSHMILSVFVVYYIWVPFRAIGEYQTRYAIQEETKMLKKVDNLKQNFISLMSHDLKTPVAKIAGIADILKVQYDNTPKQHELLTNIVASTQELNNFITSILDLTKIESQNLDLRLENKDVNNLIETTVDKLRFEASSNQMTIEKNLGPLYPIRIDVVLINRVLSNLVGNAIKYAGEGKTINVTSWDDDDWVYIEIADNGLGISEDDVENIFDKFYRVKNDSSHKIKGSGLGLYLVKYFIELHHGMIRVESDLGVGTKFIIQLKNA